MQISNRFSGRFTVLAVALVVVGCATSGGRVQDGLAADGLCLDGLLLNAGPSNLHEILERRLAHRTPQWFDARLPGPLVLVDGMPVDGVQRLATMQARGIASVETLDGFFAETEYGPRARDGAIVVLTKAGLEAGAARRPGVRPALYCGNPAG